MTNAELAELNRQFPLSGVFPGKPVYIYGLVDPRTSECRYIGKSTRPAERLTNHMNERSNCHRSHWLQELRRLGLVGDEFERGWWDGYMPREQAWSLHRVSRREYESEDID